MTRENGFIPKDGLIVLAVGALLLALVLYAANLWLGNLNQDEGWYLYAALENAAGRLPYRDFFFSQGPLMPRVYGLLAPLWAPAGVAGGRALTALFGLCGALRAGWLAARGAPRGRWLACGITAFLLTGCNVYHSYFTTIPKTYALASLLLLAGLAALWNPDQLRAAWRAALGGLLLAGAACTRLSLGIALPVAAPLALGLVRLRPRRPGRTGPAARAAAAARARCLPLLQLLPHLARYRGTALRRRFRLAATPPLPAASGTGAGHPGAVRLQGARDARSRRYGGAAAAGPHPRPVGLRGRLCGASAEPLSLR
jgi:hypothetical protein